MNFEENLKKKNFSSKFMVKKRRYAKIAFRVWITRGAELQFRREYISSSKSVRRPCEFPQGLLNTLIVIGNGGGGI